MVQLVSGMGEVLNHTGGCYPLFNYVHHTLSITPIVHTSRIKAMHMTKMWRVTLQSFA